MRYISFAWTTEAIVKQQKTVTRRHWQDSFAEKFHAGNRVWAYDKLPRFGGQRIALLELTEAPYKENTLAMPTEDWQAEGFEYLTSIGATVRGQTPCEFWNAWHKVPGEDVWVIRFKIVDVLVPALNPKTGHHKFTSEGPYCDICGNDADSGWHEVINNG